VNLTRCSVLQCVAVYCSDMYMVVAVCCRVASSIYLRRILDSSGCVMRLCVCVCECVRVCVCVFEEIFEIRGVGSTVCVFVCVCACVRV